MTISYKIWIKNHIFQKNFFFFFVETARNGCLGDFKSKSLIIFNRIVGLPANVHIDLYFFQSKYWSPVFLVSYHLWIEVQMRMFLSDHSIAVPQWIPLFRISVPPYPESLRQLRAPIRSKSFVYFVHPIKFFSPLF